MVVVRLKGDFGNQMCQYALGRIIAEQKGHSLILDESNDGWKNVLPDLFPNFKLPVGKRITSNQIMIGPNLQHLDLTFAINHPGLLFLHGYWQKHYFYTPYVSQIREWFYYDDSSHDKPGPDNLVIHCRLAKLNEHHIKPPIHNFVDISKTIEYDKCIIVTDDPNSPLLKEFDGIKNMSIRSKSRMEDFTFLRYAKQLIISQSSYSWWASFLGNQQKVYAPLTIDPSVPSYWKAKPNLINDPELIPDNEKYVKFYI